MCHPMPQYICKIRTMPLSGDKELDDQIKNWVKWDHNADTLCQIMGAVEKQDWKMYVLHRDLTNPRLSELNINSWE